MNSATVGRQRTDANWRFYLGLEQAAESVRNSVPFVPSAVRSYAEATRLWRHYPLIIDEGGEVRSFPECLDEIIDRAEAAGAPSRICAAERGHLLSVIVQSAQNDSMVDALASRDRLAETLSLSEAGRAELGREWERLTERFGERWQLLLPGGPDIVLELFGHLVGGSLREARSRARQELQQLLHRCDDFLRLDRGRHAPDPETLNRALGRAGGLIDTAAMARAVEGLHGTRALTPDRLEKLTTSRQILERFLSEDDHGDTVFMQPGLMATGISELEDLAVIEEDGFTNAVERFETRAERLTELVRAVRTALAIIGDTFDEASFEPVIEALDWRDAGPLSVFAPVVLVVDDMARIQTRHLGDFATLLASGLPIRVLLLETPLPLLDGEPIPADPADLALGFREVAVARCALARPGHLVQTFAEHLMFERAAVTVVSVPPPDSPAPLLFCETALRARVTPLFRYDPSKGDQMAERFSLQGNPDAESTWAEPGVTPADAAALLPEWLSHFLPREEKPDEWVAIGEAEDTRPHLPGLTISDEQGRELQAIVSRRLELVCHERRRHWRLLQEQAGIHNAHARRAAETARAEIREELGRRLAEREQAWSEELVRTRDEAVRRAMADLAGNLLSLEPEQRATLASPPVEVARAEPPASAEPEPEPPEEPEQEEDDLPLSSEPFVDTALCTSCDACTKINKRMFAYNGDGQAYIADASAGTFAQLVRAAEECPARIIHPGTPRADDKTASDDLIERAARFQ